MTLPMNCNWRRLAPLLLGRRRYSAMAARNKSDSGSFSSCFLFSVVSSSPSFCRLVMSLLSCDLLGGSRLQSIGSSFFMLFPVSCANSFAFVKAIVYQSGDCVQCGIFILTVDDEIQNSALAGSKHHQRKNTLAVDELVLPHLDRAIECGTHGDHARGGSCMQSRLVADCNGGFD